MRSHFGWAEKFEIMKNTVMIKDFKLNYQLPIIFSGNYLIFHDIFNTVE